MLIIALASVSLLQAYTPVKSFDHFVDTHHPIKLGRYVSLGSDGHAVWVVRGKNFTLDLKGVILQGNSASGQLNTNKGIGILLEDCQNVTLKNASVSGFRFNIMSRRSTGVHIEGCTADGSRAIQIKGEHGPVDTFLNLRDLAAWRSYGAGIWIEKGVDCLVSKCAAGHAQNGILFVDCKRCNAVENSCSYNSGWGLGVWGGDRNTLAWNHADFCNRPWRGGWGGDAAGIVAANGAYSNQFIANSITHGGDGFFLTDKVNGGYDDKSKSFHFEGASNNNFIAHNDGSWSSHNAFEGTFSQYNLYYANRANDSKYGFWLGFSTSAFVIDNEAINEESDGVAIGQGPNNTLFRNRIERCGNAGIHIWSEGGPAEKMCPSLNNQVFQNIITTCKQGIHGEKTLKLTLSGNTLDASAKESNDSSAMANVKQLQLLANWKYSPTAKRLDGWFARRPKGWQFYREMSLPKGSSALVAGQFAPEPIQ